MVGETAAATLLQIKDGRFVDDRWVGGRWDLSKFANAAGETDWDLVSRGRGGEGGHGSVRASCLLL